MVHRFSPSLFAVGIVVGALTAAAVLVARAYASPRGTVLIRAAAARPLQYGPGYGGSGSTRSSSSAPAKVHVARTKLGRILVDGRGRTLYLFEKDKRGMSACNGPCTGPWPPLTTKGKPVAGVGAKASLLGTTKRRDGTMQVTYRGHPLYHFVLDARPGDARGEGLDEFGAEWYAVSPAGRTAEGDGS